MVEQTNLYACQVLGEKAETNWANMNRSEIFAFLGMAILMGVAHYWQKDPVFHYSPVAERISRD